MSAPCFLFPGQGSQVLGMGKAFYDHNEEVKALFEEASDITGLDIAELCFHGPFETLTETKNLQPAMTTVVLACLLGMEEYDVIPAFVAGHSLGEYSALAAARVISYAECLQLVTLRGQLMQKQAEAHPGAMTAFLYVDPAKLEEFSQDIGSKHPLCLANHNSPDQIVASGSLEAIEALETAVKGVGGRMMRLKVSGAWHSPLMKGAEGPFAEALDKIKFEDAKVPVLMNVTGAAETDGDTIKSLMKQQMCSGVRWYQGIRAAWLAGCRTFVELGPKGVLTKMLPATVPDKSALVTYVVDSPVALDSFLKDDEF